MPETRRGCTRGRARFFEEERGRGGEEATGRSISDLSSRVRQPDACSSRGNISVAGRNAIPYDFSSHSSQSVSVSRKVHEANDPDF